MSFKCSSLWLDLFPFISLWYSLHNVQITLSWQCWRRWCCTHEVSFFLLHNFSLNSILQTVPSPREKGLLFYRLTHFPTFLMINIHMLDNNASPAEEPGFTRNPSPLIRRDKSAFAWSLLFMQLWAQTQVGLCNTSKTRLRNSVHSMSFCMLLPAAGANLGLCRSNRSLLELKYLDVCLDVTYPYALGKQIRPVRMT